jgi:hypothetical protein
MNFENNKSPHILNTSSNLLGFCLIVLTSLKISKFSEVTLIDECTGVASILLMISSFFSFLSIRSSNDNLIYKYERVADTVFLIALVLVFSITFLIAFTVIF